MKQCSKCKEWKDFSEFSKASARKDGLQSYCKRCAREKVSQYSKTDKAIANRKVYRKTEKFKKYNRISMAQYRKTDKGKEVFSQLNKSEKGKQRHARHRKTDKYKARHQIESRRYKENNPEIIKAHNAVNLAIRQGKLPKVETLICNCGNQARHYHHYLGYSPENKLNVIPLCIQCHVNEHNNQVPIE